MKKILIVGEWAYEMYEESFARALREEQISVEKCSWKFLFKNLVGRFESKYSFSGPMTILFNLYLVLKVLRSDAEVVLFWHAIRVCRISILIIRRLKKVHFSSYCHDDFSGPILGAPIPQHHSRMWRSFLSISPLLDSHFVKREHNIVHLESLGCKNVKIMPMWFDPFIHHPVELSEREKEKFGCDVAFIGHFEPDGRDLHIKRLIDADINFKLWGGTAWANADLGKNFNGIPKLAMGDEYAKAVSGAKICLCFLSKLNQDVYTRRCFEIPAIGRLLLAERSDYLSRLFVENEEIVFFDSPNDLLSKIKLLLADDNLTRKIAAAGCKKVWDAGHDINSRVRYFIDVVSRGSEK